MSISLFISGVTGKLGKVVAEELENTESIFLAGGHASASNKNLGKPLNSILNIECEENLISDFNNIDYKIDAVLDVSSIDNFQHLTEFCLKKELPFILASTGHSEDQLSSLKKYSEDLPILIAPNLSLGVNLLKKSLLPLKNNESISKIEITETHHKEKKDSPSGTAKDLAEFIDKNLHLKVNTVVKSIRDESSVGIHEVKISLDNDELIITHNAFDRKIFAKGAIKAIEWIVAQKPGLYSMQEISF
mgnify:FL=1